MYTPITAPNPHTIDPNDDSYWAQVRAHFMTERGHVYFNNASLGMPPKPVAEAVAWGFRRLSENPTMSKKEMNPYFTETVQPEIATFLGVDPEELAFTRNASESLHDIANSIVLEPGDEVIMTTHEHPGSIRPWQVKAERSDIKVKVVPMPSPIESADQVFNLLKNEITERTKVLTFCHVTRGGYLYPVKRLCDLARECGILSAVDGAQAVGMLKLNLRDLGCDLYANSLHKWFLGPSGTGFLYVRKDIQDTFRSLYSPDSEGMSSAGKYEMPGTFYLPIRASLGTAMDFLNRIGIQNIEARLRMLSDYLRTELLKIPQVRLLSSTSHDISSPGSTLFEIEGVALSTWVGPFLEEAQLHVDDHNRDGHDGMRISTHYYISKEEIDRFIVKLKELIERKL